MTPDHAVTAKTACARIDKVGSAAIVPYPVILRAIEIGTVTPLQFLLLVIITGEQDMPATEILAPGRAGLICFAA